jgi:hypothetical protein
MKAQILTTLSYEGSIYDTEVLQDSDSTEEDLPVRTYLA